MQLYIGLDGGGTGCRAQAMLADGRRSEVLIGGSANIHSAPDTATREIAALLERCLAAAQTLAAVYACTPPQVVLGLAGASESGAGARLAAALPYARLAVLGDVDIALSGAFEDQDGIVLAVGTGSVLARQQAGQMMRLGGYGFVLGDEGSGAWIGRQALARTLHARDGLAPDGALCRAFWDRFGALADVIGFAGVARPADFAALAPLVLEHDRAGCAVAGAILDEACDWLARAITRLQDGAPDMPVAPLGGLGPTLLDRIDRRNPGGVRIVAPRGSALDGALWRARRMHGQAAPNTERTPP